MVLIFDFVFVYKFSAMSALVEDVNVMEFDKGSIKPVEEFRSDVCNCVL